VRLQIGRAAQAGQLAPLPGESAERATAQFSAAARQVGSSLAQLVSAATTGTDRQHVGASAVDAAQALRQFTHSVHTVCSTRKETVVERYVYVLLLLLKSFGH
jgi:hypothetical protein